MFDFADLLDEEFRAKPLPPPEPTHCDVPLKYNKQRAAVGIPGYRQVLRKTNQCKREWIAIQEVLGQQDPDYYDLAHTQYYLLNVFTPPYNSLVNQEFEQQGRVSEYLWNLQQRAFSSMATPTISLIDYSLSEDEKGALIDYYNRKAFFEEAVLSSGSSSFVPENYFKKVNNVTFLKTLHVWIAVTKNLCFFKVKGVDYLVSRDHLLILSDLASQRYLLRRWCLLEQKSLAPSIFPVGLLAEFFEAGDIILQFGGNQAYDIVYKMEPLALSHLIGDLPVGKPDGAPFHIMILDEINNLAEKLGLISETERLVSILKIARQHSPIWISQLFGLYRIWGHPTLEPLEGTIALKKIATPVRFTNGITSTRITLKFKEEFIKRYIARHHTWPLLDLRGLPESNIIRIAYERKSGYPDKHVSYSRHDLIQVKFKKLFPVDPKFDLIELIADKSLSLPTPELVHCIQRYGHCGTAVARSVLLNWLHSPIQDPEEFLKLVDTHGFNTEERTVGVREKEREGKMKARLFGLMTLQKRTYIVLTEALLAEHIIPFFPEITMTDSELALDKKRYLFTQKDIARNCIIVSLDFAKWNSNMRSGETRGVFQSFDQMFGFNSCFTRTHEMFEDSWMYLLNGSYLPLYDEHEGFLHDLGTWKGHLGGIEGLRQKGWTVWTVCLILLAAENMPFKLQLMGQGDNQILRLIFPPNIPQADSDKVLYEFLEKLDTILQSTGPPLKLEETWASRDLYVYGKYLIYKGQPLPMSAKRLARMFRLSNEDYPTMESALSSLSANLTSALSCDFKIGSLLILYLSELIGLFQLSFRSCYFQKKDLYSIFSKPNSVLISGEKTHRVTVPVIFKNRSRLTDLQLSALCLYPRALGGFPVLNIFDCLLRGFPDEVSFSVSSLKRIFHYSDSNLQHLILRMLSPPFNPNISFQLLFEHPTSLNLEIPNAPGESRRNMVIEFLKEQSPDMNYYIKTFLELVDSDEDKFTIDYLSKVSPMTPRILSLIAGSTAGARARQVAGKLQKTKTIATLARTVGNRDLYSRISSAEINHLGGILRILFSNVKSFVSWNPYKCSVDHSCELRSAGWQLKIEGCDCVPPQEFAHFELQLRDGECLSDIEKDKGYIGIRIDPSVPFNDLNNPMVGGAFPPYRGSVTRQKVTGYGDKIASSSEPILQKILRVYSLIGWGIKQNGNLHSLCDKLLEARTDLDPSLLLLSEEDVTGSTHHRLQDLRTGHGGSVPILPNYGSKFVFDTFPLSAYSKGSKNVNLMFQAIMSSAVVYLGELLSLGWLPSQPVIHLHVESSCCVRDISEELIDGPNLPEELHFKTDVENKYLFISGDSIRMRTSLGIQFPVDIGFSRSRDRMFEKFHMILSEEMFHLISPQMWDSSIEAFHTSQLVINWVLPCHTSYLICCLCLRIASHYLGTVKPKSVLTFLGRVAERVDRSPLSFWKRLGALVFAPGFHHHISGPSLKGKIHGNPVSSEESLGRTLRWTCSGLLYSWSQNRKSMIKILDKVMVCGRPFCGMSQHPSFVLLLVSWVKDEIPGDQISQTKIEIGNLLTAQQENENIASLNNYASELFRIGKTRITSENLDYLCKQPIPQGGVPCYSVNKSLIPLAGEIIKVYSSDDLIHSITHLSDASIKGSETSYYRHFQKLYGLPTSGTYKFFSFSPLLPPDCSRVLCTGDGAGGFTLGTLLTSPLATVFYNSLIQNEVPLQQCPPIPYLPALAGYPQLEERVIGLDITNEIVSDLTNPLLSVVLKNRLRFSPELITCDAETSESDTLKVTCNLSLGIINLALVLKPRCVVMKVYGKCPHLLAFQISLFANHFTQVRLFRSHFSSRWNTEFYLIADQLTNNPRGNLDLNKWEGKFLKDPLVTELNAIIREISDLDVIISTETLNAYHELLGKQGLDYLTTEVIRSIPSLQLSQRNVYPNFVSDWIQATSSKTAGNPSVFRITLTTKVLHHSYVKKWAINYLIPYILVQYPNNPLILDELYKTGNFIWYRLINKRWDTSLYFGEVPDFSEVRSVRSYRLSELIPVGELKQLYRLMGAISLLNPSIVFARHDIRSEVRGFVNREIGSKDSLWKAEHGWIQTHIQHINYTQLTSNCFDNANNIWNRISRYQPRRFHI